MYIRQKALIFQMLLLKQKDKIFKIKSRFWNSEKSSKNHKRELFQSESRTFIKKK